ncbi:MAG TPA: hypothetical protein VFE50_02750 [Cyclobacteriaceae bacterium]|nr:hypothetical protein [Cyclobacteriaceae bacterium]
MDQQGKLNELASMMRHPLKLLRSGGQLGLKVIKILLLTVVAFATINLVAITIALIKLVGAMQQNWLHFTGVLAFAALSMTIMAILVYRSIKLELSLAVYNLTKNYLEKLAGMIVTKIKQATPTATVDRIMDNNSMVREAYSMVPAPLRNLVVFFIQQVPMVGLISASKTTILKENQQQASNFLFTSLNVSIREAIERKLGPWRIWLTLLITILLQVLVISRMK